MYKLVGMYAAPDKYIIYIIKCFAQRIGGLAFLIINKNAIKY